ncbi:16S rRNA (uracil(1498)-N(3))-methyltransferase [Aureitalea sp. L0-47]|uniref:16S rRNA (uracil(1498)-N(3))-methyltransferase n=1 Tax=Aureitalea sp. L0-47 TaxID=2816962 RepID=UPI002237D5D3|nr:16S rRNA (uracil(1498)-N(3))-methyltransferase [Aureitalea sp. L0-47]MCW5519344.1 16S rRNA (uracil(1498)-N(3))-methyltransferase [Aureitalea sp. L0-47]
MQLFYHPNLEADAGDVSFDKDESRHISKALRKQHGDILFITNGRGFLFTAELSHVDHKSCLAKITSVEKKPALPYHLHLAVAPTKLNDRYEWFLEKATEIGVTEITPIICDHSERKVIKAERYERIIQSAMKQSLKVWKPELNPVISFNDFMKKSFSEEKKCIAHCYPSEKESLKHTIDAGDSVIILIGPEGDFSHLEVEQAVAEGFQTVHLGNSRLRTETAAIVACHSIAFINEG